MLNRTITVEKLIDRALLNLWYAAMYESMAQSLPKEFAEKQKQGFILQASGIIQALEAMGIGGPLVEYTYRKQTVRMPQYLAELFLSRERAFCHPKDI